MQIYTGVCLHAPITCSMHSMRVIGLVTYDRLVIG